MYGSVTTAEIADKLGEAVEREIDRRKITLESPIKELGTHKVSLRLTTEVVAEFDVVVDPLEEAEPVELEETPAEE